MLTNNIIIIPARKNSKTIKNKNIKKFSKKPLIYWTIKLAIASKLGLVCVSTDCKKIRNYALSIGASVPFLRPKKFATDTATTESVILHAISHYKKNGFFFKNFILLQPTSPLRSLQDLNDAWKLFKNSKNCTSVFSVREAIANNNPNWMVKINKFKKVEGFVCKFIPNFLTRRQDLPKVYIRNDYVYVSEVKNILLKKPNLYGKNPKVLITDKNRIDIDINSPTDWKAAEYFFNYN